MADDLNKPASQPADQVADNQQVSPNEAPLQDPLDPKPPVVSSDQDLPDFTQVGSDSQIEQDPKPVPSNLDVNDQLPEELSIDKTEDAPLAPVTENPPPTANPEADVQKEPVALSPIQTEPEIPVAPEATPTSGLAKMPPAVDTNSTEPIQTPESTTPNFANIAPPSQESVIQPAGQPEMAAAFGVAPTVAPSSNFPPELKGWNWGAFFLSWIWAIGNKVWIGLIAILGPLWLPMIIILGLKGNQWAWKSRQFASVDEFRQVQSKWAKWGIGFFVLQVLIMVLLTSAIISSLKTSSTSSSTTTTTTPTYNYQTQYQN